LTNWALTREEAAMEEEVQERVEDMIRREMQDTFAELVDRRLYEEYTGRTDD
jgi:hypothetical protein